LVQKLVKAIGKNLAAHFVGAHGTPVEKHWFSVCLLEPEMTEQKALIKNVFVYHMCNEK
jgi:hypothetical protein